MLDNGRRGEGNANDWVDNCGRQYEKMVRFYNAVFNAGLKETVHIGPEQFYGGKLADIELTLCPNAIAGVVAEQNRQQFRFEVSDIEAVIERGLANHGSEINPVDEYKGAKVASLADPGRQYHRVCRDIFIRRR